MNNKAGSGSKPGKKSPKHAEHNAYGTSKKPFGQSDDKARLLARMKAAADAKKAG